MIVASAAYHSNRRRRIFGFCSSIDMTSTSAFPRSPINSLHCRNDKTRIFTHAAFGPARRDRFDTGIEAHAFRDMLVDIAERRPLPAAEGVIGQRHGYRYIDSDHAHLDL